MRTVFGWPRTSFRKRWLRQDDGRPSAELLNAADDRANRFPFPANLGARILAWLVDLFAPLLILGRLCPVGSLTDDEFSKLQDRALRHRNGWIRMAFTALLQPVFECRFPDVTEPDPVPPPTFFRGVTEDADCDVLVIGSGAGGAPVAWRLARSGLKVTVVERGDVVHPEPAEKIIERHFIQQGLVPYLGRGVNLILAARALGGTTVVNSGTCLRPLQERLEAWDQNWGTRFAEGELTPWLADAENMLAVETPGLDVSSESTRVFQRGLSHLGREGAYILPRNAAGCRGSGRCCFGCPTGAKRGMDRACLEEARDSGAKILIRTRATRIREDLNRVVVELEDDTAGVRTIRCRHLVVACGALATPFLLSDNRLGTHGSKAGTHLGIHPALKVVARMPGSRHTETGVPQGLGYRPPELPRIVLEGIHTPLSVAGPILVQAGSQVNWWIENAKEMLSFGVMLRERSLGRLGRLGDHIYAVGSLEPEDARDLGEAVRLIAQTFFAAGADRVLLPLGDGPVDVRDPGELNRLDWAQVTAESVAAAGFHPHGTAGIGRVVDPDLRLRGSRRISVCDASVLPSSPGVNPQISIAALSLRLGHRLARELC